MTTAITSAAHRLFRSKGPLLRLAALFSALRMGKLHELCRFIVLEFWYYSHKIVAGRHSRLIEFAREPFACLAPGQPISLCDLQEVLAVHRLDASVCRTAWKVATRSISGQLCGSTYDRPCVLQLADVSDAAATDVAEFESPITAILSTSSGALLVGTIGSVYRCVDDVFEKVLELSHPSSYVWHNHGIDETPDGIVLGEYGCVIGPNRHRQYWQSLAYVYISSDNGRKWCRINYFADEKANKHLHLVRYSHRLQRLFVTDGDSRKGSFWFEDISVLDDARGIDRGRFDSFFLGGGHTSFCETESTVFIGTDYHGGTNQIVSLQEGLVPFAWIVPHPHRRYPVMNMHTVTGPRRTLVFVSVVGGLSGRWRSLLFYSADDGRSWKKLIEYDGIDVGVQILNGAEQPSPTLLLSIDVDSRQERKTFIVRPST